MSMPGVTHIAFTVYGEQKPQGSKLSHALYGKDGQPLMKNGRVLTVTRNDNPDVMAWRSGIAAAARQAYAGPLLLGPLRLAITFYRPRPAGHFGTGKNAAQLKALAPALPITKPDTVKLARAVEDALTGVVWRDDSQVCKHILDKEFGTCFCTAVIIESL